MNCISKTIFDFFEVKDCFKCDYHKNDEFIIIGKNNINIYYVRYCYKRVIDLNFLYNTNFKVKMFYKDAIINQKDIIFLIIDNFDLNKMMSDLEILLNMGLDIHILAI